MNIFQVIEAVTRNTRKEFISSSGQIARWDEFHNSFVIFDDGYIYVIKLSHGNTKHSIYNYLFHEFKEYK